jgi:hypothetical protein
MQETSVGWSATGVTPIHELRQGPTLTEYPRAKSPADERVTGGHREVVGAGAVERSADFGEGVDDQVGDPDEREQQRELFVWIERRKLCADRDQRELEQRPQRDDRHEVRACQRAIHDPRLRAEQRRAGEAVEVEAREEHPVRDDLVEQRLRREGGGEVVAFAGRELRAEKEAHRAREGDEAATPADHVRDADAPLGVFAPQPRTS